MKERGFWSCGKYIQGQGVLRQLYRYAAPLGQRCLLIVSRGGLERLAPVLDENDAGAADAVFRRAVFGGECTMPEIRRLTAEAQARGCDAIVGIGGGKVLDTAKAVAHFAGLPVIIAPTSAASDAPCSALSVVYREDGSLDTLLSLRRNPDLVLADSEIIAKAPVRLLSAGMGDALATYYEMKECRAAGADNFFGQKITLAAGAIAGQCRDTLLEDGRAAFRDAARGLCTPAVENVIEANILLSGIGFESGGVCAAHPINEGLAALPGAHDTLHGEKVAFALLAQMVLSGEPAELLRETMAFLRDVRLPVTLEELGIVRPTEEDLAIVAAAAMESPSIHRMTRPVDAAAVIDAVRRADALGRDFLAGQ